MSHSLPVPPGNQSPYPRVEPAHEKEPGDQQTPQSGTSVPAVGDDASADTGRSETLRWAITSPRSRAAKTVATILGVSALTALIGAVVAAARQPKDQQPDKDRAGRRNKK
jgi:hypothetical protein